MPESMAKLTLVALLLDFKRLREILVLFPLNRRADSAVVDKVALVANLLLVQVSLLQDRVLEEIILGEVEEDLEPGVLVLRGQVRDGDIDESLERVGVTIGDHLAERGVVPQRRQPKFGDSGRFVLQGEGYVIWVILLGLSCARLDLLSGWLRLSQDNRAAALMQGLLELSVLLSVISHRATRDPRQI